MNTARLPSAASATSSGSSGRVSGILGLTGPLPETPYSRYSSHRTDHRSSPRFWQARLGALALAVGYLLLSLAWSSQVLGQGVRYTLSQESDIREMRDRSFKNENGIAQHERRILELEGQRTAERLVKLETYAESNRQLLMGVTLAVLVMAAEAALRMVGGRRKSAE